MADGAGYEVLINEHLDKEADFERRLPTCAECGCKLHDDCYRIGGELLCEDCVWTRFGVSALDYMED